MDKLEPRERDFLANKRDTALVLDKVGCGSDTFGMGEAERDDGYFSSTAVVVSVGIGWGVLAMAEGDGAKMLMSGGGEGVEVLTRDTGTRGEPSELRLLLVGEVEVVVSQLD